VGCPDTRCSTSGFSVFLGNSQVSWSSKRQSTMSCLSTQADYCVVANIELLGKHWCSLSKGHGGLLQLHVCGVHIHQSSAPQSHETHRALHPLRSGICAARWPSCPPCSDWQTVCGYHDQRSSYTNNRSFSVQSMCCWDMYFVWGCYWDMYFVYGHGDSMEHVHGHRALPWRARCALDEFGCQVCNNVVFNI
jgi:hypothetical protein